MTAVLPDLHTDIEYSGMDSLTKIHAFRICNIPVYVERKEDVYENPEKWVSQIRSKNNGAMNFFDVPPTSDAMKNWRGILRGTCFVIPHKS